MQGQPVIVVFDSGVGGLSILAGLTEKVRARYEFVSDNGFFPYGVKTEQALIDRVSRVMELVVSRYNPDIVVVACNTASTVTLPHIRAKFNVPFVGVVPAIKPAAAMTKSHAIGLLATPATVKRPYTAKLIEDFANHCQVHMHGSATLVSLAEAKLQGKLVDLSIVARELDSLLSQSPSIDTVVLGCTHFPLLLDELSRVAGRTLNWVDSSQAIARRVSELLQERSSAKEGSSSIGATFTRKDDAISQIMAAIGEITSVSADTTSVLHP